MTETTSIAEFSATEAGLNALAKKYAVVPDATTPEGYDAIKEALNKEIVPLRTGLDKMRLKLNEDDQARIKARNAEAQRIQARIAKVEKPFQDAKKAVDDEKKRLEDEARQKEQDRITAITDRIARMRADGDSLLGADSEALLKRIRGLEEVDTAQGFDEFADAATQARDEVLEKLHRAHGERVQLEERQREAARVQLEQEAKQKQLDEQAADLKRQQNEIAEKQAAEDARIEAEKTALRAEAERLARKKREEAASDETPAPVKQTANSDVSAIVAYVDALLGVHVPVISDPKLRESLEAFVLNLRAHTDSLCAACDKKKAA